MIGNIIAALSAFIIHVISALGYPGIVLLMAIESACIPLPSEVIMPFSGALTLAAIAGHYGREPFSLVLVAFFGALGCNVGSEVAYAIGYYGGRPLVEKYGSYLLLSRRELDWADHFFARYGDRTVFLSRLLPVVRTFIALPAGVARMPRLRFHIFTFIGSFPWCLALAYVGMKLGERWESDPRLKTWFHRFDALILAVIVLGVAAFIWTRWKHRIKAPSGDRAI
ncbi:MAG TPA: DedA family protein [Terriglobales bacterium]|nr:DedA family protein [Terriglobales bacterium]